MSIKFSSHESTDRFARELVNNNFEDALFNLIVGIDIEMENNSFSWRLYEHFKNLADNGVIVDESTLKD